MPPGMVLTLSAGLNPPVIGIYAGGACGCVGTECGDSPDEENGRRLPVPGIVGEWSIGRVRGNTEADQRCGVRALELASSPCKSVMGRSSREDVARCMAVRLGAMVGWASAGIDGLSKWVVYDLREESSAFNGGRPRFLCVTSTHVDFPLISFQVFTFFYAMELFFSETYSFPRQNTSSTRSSWITA
jgi:hypothetical protein